MIITVTVDLRIERADGSSTTIAETITHNSGDNPNFENGEVIAALDTAVQRTTERAVQEPTA